jgi:hypothetical protein
MITDPNAPPFVMSTGTATDDFPEVETGAPLYLSVDGYTLISRDDKGAFHSVGVVTERTADGYVARLHGKIKSVSVTGKIVP